MGWSRKRRVLLGGLEEALVLMTACGVLRVCLDGSFVTDKGRLNDIDGRYDLVESVTTEDLRRLAPIFSQDFSNRAATRRCFGMDLFPAAVTELGSGQPYLRFFQTGRAASEEVNTRRDP